MHKLKFSLIAVLLTAAFVSLQADTDTNDYLHLISLKGGDTVRLDKSGNQAAQLSAQFEYSTDNRQTWANYEWHGTIGDTIALTNAGDIVWFRAGKDGTAGTNGAYANYDKFFKFVFGADDSIAAGGNTMSLYDGSCKQTSIYGYGFFGLFSGCHALITAPQLPATQLANSCYTDMFNGCSSLTTAPELPAQELAQGCYSNMFVGCSSLTAAPELPATKMYLYCYTGMFTSCHSLKKAPSLQVTKLDHFCFSNMFKDCTSLRIDTCDGNCAGAMLVVSDTAGTFNKWNSNMFQNCQGDSTCTAEDGIKLGGHYCIMGTNFTVTVEANDTTMGTVTGGGIYDCGDTVTITATANEGYDFVGWSTGDKTPTLTFIMGNGDTTITATFEVVSAVEQTEADRYVACVEANDIVVYGVADRTVAIYDMNGRLVAKIEKASDIERFAVGMAGVYVISVDNMAETRVIVK